MGKVEAFKNELRNYNYYLKELVDINNKIEVNFYKKTGVSGVSYDKIPCHSSEEALANYRLTLIEQGDELAIERERIVKQIKYINTKLDKLDKKIQLIVIWLYVDGMPYEKVAKQVNYSVGGLYKLVNNKLIEIL